MTLVIGFSHMPHKVEYLEHKYHNPAVVAAIAETRLELERGCAMFLLGSLSAWLPAIHPISKQSRGS